MVLAQLMVVSMASALVLVTADEKVFVWLVLVEAMEILSLLAVRMIKLVVQGLVSE